MRATWQVPDDGVDLGATSGATTLDLRFVVSSVRRLWYLWLAVTLIGAMAATGWLLVGPTRSVGTVTLLLAHAPGSQPETAMATDISLLRTRTVAEKLSDRLSLDESAEDIQASIVTEPTTSSVLQVDIIGSDPDSAAARARALAEVYLDFREDQLLTQNDAVIEGHQQRIATLQAQADDLTEQYDLITGRGGNDEQAADILTLRAQLLSQITSHQNAIEEASLEVAAVVAASRVLDPASVVPQSALRRTALVLGSGTIGGLGIGLGLVLVYSLSTNRLRTRADVAAAIGHPVAFSAGDPSRRWLTSRLRRASDLDILVDGFLTALPRTGRRPARLTLVSVDCAQEAAMVVVHAAYRLGEHQSVAVVDLTGKGVLAEAASTISVTPGPGLQPAVTVVDTATDAVADVVLTLVPVEIGRGFAHVKASARRVVVLVKAGRSTAEGLRTVSRAARAAGVGFEFVMLVGADPSDESFGASEEAFELVEQTPRASP